MDDEYIKLVESGKIININDYKLNKELEKGVDIYIDFDNPISFDD